MDSDSGGGVPPQFLQAHQRALVKLEAIIMEMRDAQARCASRMFVAFAGGLLLGVAACSALAWLILP